MKWCFRMLRAALVSVPMALQAGEKEVPCSEKQLLPEELNFVPSSSCSDYLFKLLLIGDSGVGKSCLLLRFAVSA